MEGDKGVPQKGCVPHFSSIGRLAYELGYEGLLVPSARLKGEKNLVIFARNLPNGALKVQNVGKLPEPK